MSFENVVLQYPQPHIVVYVEDNTVYQETFLAAEEPVKMIQCGVFQQGRDNQLIYCDTYDQFIAEFGEPNYKLYGQAGYNIARALKTQYAAAYVMRVMPDDATYANVVVSVKYKVDETEPDSKKLSIGFTTSYISEAKTKKELQEAFDQLKQNKDAGEDGYYTQPWFYAYQTGRGTYGNATRIRLLDATAYDDPENDYRSYRFDVLQMQNTLKRLESAYGSVDVDLFDTDTKESLYLPDLINDVEEGFTKVNVHFNDALTETLTDLYNTTFTAEMTTKTMDIVFGKTMAGISDTNIEFTEDSVDLAETDGFNLFGGSDGALDVKADGRDAAINAALVKAYGGQLDKMINSRYSTPADFMLDANFAEDVKKSMVTLALKREYDAMAYIDCGLCDTTDQLIQWGTTFKDIYGDNVIKQGHHYKVRDTDYTGKTIDVTTTYFMAGLIPRHFKTKGLNEPMAMDNAVITEAVKGSFAPIIDPDENDVKKELYNLRINYFETVKYNTYQRGVAITSGRVFSDRLDEFNEYILHLAVAKATDVLKSKIYKLGEEEDRKNYTETANKELQYVLGPLVRSVTVEFKMSADDERKSILRLALRIVYKTVVKRGIVEIYLDPRA